MKHYKFPTMVMNIILINHVACANEITISQMDKKFAPAVITIKAGDSLRFVNDDAINHNVFTEISPGNTFNSGLQKPGASSTVVFAKAGDHEVRCGIHPRMKMIVHVQ